MISTAEIKLVRSLHDKKFRDRYGLFVVEGEKMVDEARRSSLEVVSVWTVNEIGENAMSRISQLSSPSSVLALVRKPLPLRAELPSGLCIGVDFVRDPGNLGTIIRIADWFGVSRLFVSEDSVDIFNSKVIQASMGSIFRVKISLADIPQTCRDFKAAGRQVFGTLLYGLDIYAETLNDEGLVVFGNESEGISPSVRAELDKALRIPSYGSSGAESLNVAVAAAVTLAEFRRRCR